MQVGAQKTRLGSHQVFDVPVVEDRAFRSVEDTREYCDTLFFSAADNVIAAPQMLRERAKSFCGRLYSPLNVQIRRIRTSHYDSEIGKGLGVKSAEASTRLCFTLSLTVNVSLSPPLNETFIPGLNSLVMLTNFSAQL